MENIFKEQKGRWYSYDVVSAQNHSVYCKCGICGTSFHKMEERPLVLQQYSGRRGARGNETEG